MVAAKPLYLVDKNKFAHTSMTTKIPIPIKTQPIFLEGGFEFGGKVEEAVAAALGELVAGSMFPMFLTISTPTTMKTMPTKVPNMAPMMALYCPYVANPVYPKSAAERMFDDDDDDDVLDVICFLFWVLFFFGQSKGILKSCFISLSLKEGVITK
jgi:hypothetical protein